MVEEWVIPGRESSGGEEDVTILLAVGITNFRQTIRSMFRQMSNYEILEADTGDKALRMLKNEWEARNFFVIIDWDLRSPPGVDVAREIRADKLLENLPILLIAEDAIQENVALLGELGVNGCLVKPFVFNAMQEKFTQILRERSHPPEHVRLINKGEQYLDDGSFEEALEMFLKSQEIRNTARVNVLIGEAFERLGDFNMAQKHYDESININSKYIKGYNSAAELHLRLYSETSALPYLESAAAISPYNAIRQEKLGSIYLNAGDETSAFKAFSMAIERDPSLSIDIAEKFLEHGNPKNAEHFFKKSIQLEARKVETFNRLGIALRRQGKWQEAVDIYKRAIHIDSRNGGLYFNMGRSFLEGGKTIEARGCFESALRLDPEIREAKEELKKLGFAS